MGCTERAEKNGRQTGQIRCFPNSLLRWWYGSIPGKRQKLTHAAKRAWRFPGMLL